MNKIFGKLLKLLKSFAFYEVKVQYYVFGFEVWGVVSESNSTICTHRVLAVERVIDVRIAPPCFFYGEAAFDTIRYLIYKPKET